MLIKKNDFNRFNLAGIDDKGLPGKLEIKGVKGYDGLIGTLIGLILKVFQKAVIIQGDDGTQYILNCNSLNNWAKRNQICEKEFYKHIHDPAWIETTLKNFKEKSKAIQINDKKGLQEIPKTSQPQNEVFKDHFLPESKSPEYDENVQRTEKLVPNEDLIQQNLRDELTSEKIEKSKIESKSNLQATVSVPNENILPDVNMPQSETNVSQPNTAPEQKQTIEETVEPEEEFDFNKMELNQNVVDELFNPSEEHLAKTSQRLRGLSVDSIYRLAPYFSSIHWIHLRDNKGIANLDFAYLKSNLSDDQFNRMFDELFKTSLHWGNIPASGIITKLPPESIYFLAQYFTLDHWKWFRDEQAATLDFSKFNLTEDKFKEVINELFDNSHEKRFERHTKTNAGRRIPLLSPDNINFLASYFSLEHWKYIDVETFNLLKFSKLDLD